MDFSLVNSVEEEDKCDVCLANSVQVFISVKLARICLTRQFVPYHVKFYDPAGTQHDAYLLNQLELTCKISQKDEYSMVENQPAYTNIRVARIRRLDGKRGVTRMSDLGLPFARDNHVRTVQWATTTQ